jgi:hypothetical protein
MMHNPAPSQIAQTLETAESHQTAQHQQTDYKRLPLWIPEADDIGGTVPPNLSDDLVIQRGREAWQRVAEDRTWWSDWLAIGHALMVLIAEAGRIAHTKERQGRRYNEALASLLKAHGFDRIEKSHRAKLILCMQNKDAITVWRDSLAPAKRQRLNHPAVIWRQFDADTHPSRPKPKRSSLRESMAQLQMKIAEKDAKLKRLGDGDLFTAKDRPSEIARVLIDMRGTARARTVVAELGKLVEQRSNFRQRRCAIPPVATP